MCIGVRRLADLEDRLGAQLINRSTRGLSATEIGRNYYEQCKRILEEVEEADAAVMAERLELRGVIRVTAGLSFGTRHLCPLLNAFLVDHPNLDIDLNLTDHRVEIIEDGIDLAIRIGQLHDSRLIARKLAPMRRVACASKAYLERHGRPERPEDLTDHFGLTSGNLADQVYWQFTGPRGEKSTTRPRSRLRANNGDALVSAARAGLGICAVPLFISSEAIAAGDLEPILTRYTLREDGVYAVYPPARYQSYRIRMLIDFIAARFGPNPAWELRT